MKDQQLSNTLKQRIQIGAIFPWLLGFLTLFSEIGLLIWRGMPINWKWTFFIPVMGCVLGVVALMLANRVVPVKIASLRKPVPVSPGDPPNSPPGDEETEPGDPPNSSTGDEETEPEKAPSFKDGIADVPTPSIASLQSKLDSAIRRFIVPKEGKNPQRCEDKYAFNTYLQRYMVADGVTTLFLSSKWAELISSHFVAANIDLKQMDDFKCWWTECKDEWYSWACKTWIPQAEQAGMGDYWDIHLREGSGTTFAACLLAPIDQRTVMIDVYALGDAHFFLYRAPQGKKTDWQCETFPYTSIDQFGPMPTFLGTEVAMTERYHRKLVRKQYQAGPEDYIVLATDALARWIFLQRDNGNRWMKTLSIEDKESFELFVQEERDCGAMELDDVTMLVIPLAMLGENS